MLALADKVARAARYVLAPRTEQALWTVAARGRVIGLLVCEAGAWRLTWFDGADRRMVNYAGPVDGDVEVLAAALEARLGATVELEQLPV